MDAHVSDIARAPLSTEPVKPVLFAHFVLRTANKTKMRD